MHLLTIEFIPDTHISSTFHSHSEMNQFTLQTTQSKNKKLYRI